MKFITFNGKNVVKLASFVAMIFMLIPLFGCASTPMLGNRSASPRTEPDANAQTDDFTTTAYPGRLPASLRRDLETTWNALSDLPFEASPEDAITAAERFLAITVVVEPLAGCPSEAYRLGVRTRYARRTLVAQNFAIRHDQWQRLYLAAETYSQAIKMAERIIELLHETAPLDLLSQNERFEIEQLADQWQEHLAVERQRLQSQWNEVDAWIGQQQGGVATRMGRRDLNEAKSLLEMQNRKRFNWQILGRPRDNQSLIMIAIQRAQRAADATQAAPAVRAQARDVVEQGDARLGTEMRRRLARRPPLPAYSTYPEYPHWSDDERVRLADVRMPEDEGETTALPEGIGY